MGSNDKTVYIVGQDSRTATMYLNKGIAVTQRLSQADFVTFIGGSDVDPKLYGHGRIAETHHDPARDERDMEVYNEALKLGKPMVGICRGGQFLNVMNGGYMLQHVDNHGVDHKVYDIERSKYVLCTSTHHQMMVPLKPEGRVLGIVPQSRCSQKVLSNSSNSRINMTKHHMGADTEVVWYKKTKSLCFQPHPEYNVSECREWFFELLEQHII